MNLLVLTGVAPGPAAGDETEVISFDDLRKWAGVGALPRHVFRYRDVELLVKRLDAFANPFFTSCLIRLLARRQCRIRDESGIQRKVTISRLLGLAAACARDWVCGRLMLAPRAARRVRALRRAPAPRRGRPVALHKRPVYLRTNLWFGLDSGGSIGHVAGVLNNLSRHTGPPLFISTDAVPTVNPDVETRIVTPRGRYWDFNEFLGIDFNDTLLFEASKFLAGADIGFIYHRYSINAFSGAILARKFDVPYVLEFNGSETWVGKHWGKGLHHAALAGLIEDFCLRAADVVVVVSEALRGQLIERGVAGDGILVNPNGVDADRYNPEVDGRRIRQKYGLQDRVVIGFMGTFGPWHGAEVLAEAFRILAMDPRLSDRMALLMIGDGPAKSAVKSMLKAEGLGRLAVFTGLVPQSDGPSYLAACDIFASPHVPNPDGSTFFGSPTKLFEYMAMGRPVVASNLGQIGEVLEDGRTGRLVSPGDAADLAGGLRYLLDNPGQGRRLAENARREVVARYTWAGHTGRIVEKIRERCG